MSDYIVPSEGDFDQLVEITKKAGLELTNPGNVREFILATSGDGMTVSALASKDMLVLNKNSNALLEEMPTVVMSVPGLVYSGDWVALATAFPSIDWTELESKLAKSGHLATSPEDLEKRDTGVIKDSSEHHRGETESLTSDRSRPRLANSSSSEQDDMDDDDMVVN